ncbi:MAG: hypothetical protein ACW9XH_04090 [Candidatus Nitrosopumilus sp. bin_32a]
MSDFELDYFADKVHVHRWPQDSPLWNDFIRNQFDEFINKNPQKKQIAIRDNYLKIENFEFHSLKKIGVSVPFFKDECTMILEAQYGELFAHVHITTKSENYLEIFNKLALWCKSTLKSLK